MACVEDISSDDEIHEEVSRTLDEAFLIWGKKMKDKWREFRLHLVTWNVGTASPPPDVTSLLQLDSLSPAMDMYVIGLQEVNSRITNFLSDLAFDDPWSIFFMSVLSPLGYIKVIVYISQLSQQRKKMFSLAPFIYFFSSNSFLFIEDKLMVSFAGISHICRRMNVRNASLTNSYFPDLFTKAFKKALY
ncbi:hypothetical protein CIB84_009131 [Bambusicola thoracicus]|uniref:Inositol polyphosphate-related phosphatase domain-containing protein n=1 Tax=Bambusicola thoracicus TaxID=9083 RepID=A0A2P4SSN2_BAMTH|nr:hypothetical protein CIB84_009131 [Bambusicola thoracicus]